MLLHIPVAFNQSNAISYCLKVAFTVRGHKQSEFHSGLELRGQLPFTVPSVSHAKNYPIPPRGGGAFLSLSQAFLRYLRSLLPTSPSDRSDSVLKTSVEIVPSFPLLVQCAAVRAQ